MDGDIKVQMDSSLRNIPITVWQVWPDTLWDPQF